MFNPTIFCNTYTHTHTLISNPFRTTMIHCKLWVHQLWYQGTHTEIFLLPVMALAKSVKCCRVSLPLICRYSVALIKLFTSYCCRELYMYMYIYVNLQSPQQGKGFVSRNNIMYSHLNHHNALIHKHHKCPTHAIYVYVYMFTIAQRDDCYKQSIKELEWVQQLATLRVIYVPYLCVCRGHL